MKHILLPRLEKVLSRIAGRPVRPLNNSALSQSLALYSQTAQMLNWDEAPLCKLTSTHYQIPYVPDIPPPHPHANLSSFPLSVLKRENFIVTQKSLERITIVCSDPTRVPRIRLWREGYKISLYMAPPSIIAKNLDIIEKMATGQLSTKQNQAQSQISWQCFDELLSNVLKFDVTSFEICHLKPNYSYGFFDESLVAHSAPLPPQLCLDMIETLSVARQDGAFVRELPEGVIGCELTFFNTSKTVIVNLKRLEDYPRPTEEIDDTGDLFERHSIIENKGQVIKFPTRSAYDGEGLTDYMVAFHE